ncbi:DUF2924 domain-containing protein [Bradyrhizobium sp. G127]|uniref:DUF2924 domain-containing protein n=1 Tax=Bradyrhizobium sp. G127 TaxID=2904800 RepID=UPI0032DF6023
MLRRSIAQWIQEKAYGGLSGSIKRLLDQLAKAMAAKPNGRLELPRRIKPGSELVRTWKGKTYSVVFRPDGFAYDGKTYAGLSEIASLIAARSRSTQKAMPRFYSSVANPLRSRLSCTARSS